MIEHNCGGANEPGAHITLDHDEVWVGDVTDAWTAAGITFQICSSSSSGWDMFWIARDAQVPLAKEIVSKQRKQSNET